MRELTAFGHLPLEVGAGLFQRCERVVLPGCARLARLPLQRLFSLTIQLSSPSISSANILMRRV